ncbi:MAG: hypothetical protein EA398_15905, partial [Deltaproteobacteria bacterium]
MSAPGLLRWLGDRATANAGGAALVQPGRGTLAWGELAFATVLLDDALRDAGMGPGTRVALRTERPQVPLVALLASA